MIHVKTLVKVLAEFVSIKSSSILSIREAALARYVATVTGGEEKDLVNLILSFQMLEIAKFIPTKFNTLEAHNIEQQAGSWLLNQDRTSYQALPHKIQLLLYYMVSPQSLRLTRKSISGVLEGYIDPMHWIARHATARIPVERPCNFCGIKIPKDVDICDNCRLGLSHKVEYHNDDFVFELTQEGCSWTTLPTKELGPVDIETDLFTISRIGLHEFMCIKVTGGDKKQGTLEFVEYQPKL